MKRFPAGLLSLVRRIVTTLRGYPVSLRVWALERPVLLPGFRHRVSLLPLAEQESPAIEAARRAQFLEWHPEDLQPRLDWYGKKALEVLSRDFFAGSTAEKSRARLEHAMQSLAPGSRLLVYAPHEFAFSSGTEFAWVPRLQEVRALAGAAKLRVLDFNPSFDRNGFFYFVAERSLDPVQAPRPSGQGLYFYLEVGDDPALGNSAAVLSATGLRALRGAAPSAREHSFYARVPEDVSVQCGDLTMGHYGRWVTGSRRAGGLTVLYGPGDRFRPTRNDAPFYADIQTDGTFADQYAAAHLVIMQAGGQWRMTDPFPYSGLCRWMDLPVSPAVFPRTKKRIAPPGKRVFCFIGLYDDYQKGHDIACALCRRCPEFQFIALGCKPLGVPNCREYAAVDNRRPEFRRIVSGADFIVSPARDDAQPGTIAECGSLGLLPIFTETTGYVLSFPRRLDAGDLDQCEAVLREAQAASGEEVASWQALNARYLEQFHRPTDCDALMQSYLDEIIPEIPV